MRTKVLTIVTRTPLHVGAGSSVGAIDLPVQRERHTQIPIIPGSSLKGVLRDLWNGDQEQEHLFGPESQAPVHRAGELLVGEARALLFPVRSAQGSFAWLTSPLAVRRYLRDGGEGAAEIPDLADEEALAGSKVRLADQEATVLEEYCFRAKPLPEDLPAVFSNLLPGDPLLETLPSRLVVVSDGIYSHFCANACEIQQRVRIDDETGVVARGALFNQENVPSETVFYSVLGERSDAGALAKLERRLREEGNVLQIGGDETVGLGYCSVALQPDRTS